MASSESFEIEMSRSGKPTLKLGSVYIHSRYDPVKEAYKIAKSIDTSNKKYIVIFGIGLGYHILPYLAEKDLKIIVVEKYPRLISLIKELGTIPLINRLNIFFGDIEHLQDYLFNKINECESSLIAVLVHNPSYKVDPLYYTKARDILSYVQKIKLQSYITTIAFSRRWHENTLKNIKHLSRFYTLAKKKLDIPIFIIASGASLDKNINKLYKIQRKGIIIALASVYRKLKDYGIIPHFIISIDGGVANRIHFLKEDISKEESSSFFITSLSATPGIFRIWKGGFLIVNHNLPIEDALLYGFPPIPMEGSVSLTAFNIARLISSNSIYLIGFDFSLSKGSDAYHYKGNRIEEYFVYLQCKLHSIENTLYKLVNKFQLSKVRGYNKTSLKTNSAMHSYRTRMEEEIERSGSNTVFNLNDEGAIIKGACKCSFEELIKLGDRKVVLSSIVEKITEENTFKTKDRINKILIESIKVKEFIIDNKNDLGIEQLFLYIKRLSVDLQVVFKFFQSRLLQRLNKLASISTNDINEITYFLNRTIKLIRKAMLKL